MSNAHTKLLLPSDIDLYATKKFLIKLTLHLPNNMLLVDMDAL